VPGSRNHVAVISYICGIWYKVRYGTSTFYVTGMLWSCATYSRFVANQRFEPKQGQWRFQQQLLRKWL